jgi:hypothetical protein
MAEIKTPLVYLLECGDAKSSWRVATRTLYDEARKWDRHLFTHDDILGLYASLKATAAGLKHPVAVSSPDFAFAEKHGLRASIIIGDECGIHFTPVYGAYVKE